MSTTNSAFTNSTFYIVVMLACAVVGTLACVACAIFAYPHWREYRQQQKKQRGGAAVKRPPSFVYLGVAFVVFFVASVVFGGTWLFLRFYSVHPKIFWGGVAGLSLVLVWLWWFVADNAADTVADVTELRPALALAKNEVDRLKTANAELMQVHSEQLGNIQRDWERRNADREKYLNQMKLKELDELNKKRDDEIADLKKAWEQHAAELVKQSVAPTQQEQEITPIFPSLSALHGQKPQITFNAREYFRTAYYSPVTAEIEQNMKIVAHEYDPNNHEVFYSRMLGVGAAAYHYDLTEVIIFGSQLALLAELNRMTKRAAISVARKYYDEAAQKYPNIYPNYGFDAWLGYLQSRSLVVRYPSDTAEIPDLIEITHAGRDFLKYLAHWGRDVSTKKA